MSTSRKSSRPRKPARSREYSGPPTLEAVKKYWESDPTPTKKAMEEAAKRLTPAEQAELIRWAFERFKKSMEIYRKAMDAKWERLGMKPHQE